MKRKGLYLMIALAVGGMGAAHAQSMQDNDMSNGNQNTMDTSAQSNGSMSDNSMSNSSMSSDSGYDGRWYIAPTIGAYWNDQDRGTNPHQFYYGLGFGRFISPNISLDIFADRTPRDIDNAAFRHWDNNTLGVSARFYAGGWDAWRPYFMVGAAGSHHSSYLDKGWAPAAQAGVGLSKNIGKSVAFRIEGAYRYDFDDKSRSSENGFGDAMLGVSLLARLGQPPAPPPPPPAAPPPPPQPSCDQLDNDNDGVNNCDDKCPNTESGTIVGPDGCQQKVVIDLRGVNFKFDRPKPNETDIAPTLQEPTSQSMSILDQAVDTLKRYPQVQVKVAGYTDSIGTDAYNQKLSQRRAKIVYNYLTSHGISADRLEGPVGHGENNPIDTNSTKEGRARNRRTELQVQNDNVQNNGGMQNEHGMQNGNNGMQDNSDNGSMQNDNSMQDDNDDNGGM